MREPLSIEEVQAIGEHIAEQAVHLDAAMHRLLADLRTFDVAGGWYRQGFGTCAHWLSWRVGWDLGTAREHLRVARALHTLPRVSEALSAGQISYSKTRTITRVATAATEAVLLGYAQHCTASQLETVCRKVGVLGTDAASRAARPHDSERYVAHTTTASGMVCVKACLRPDEAALLLQVLQQAAVDRRHPTVRRPQDPHHPCFPQARLAATRSHLPLPRLRPPPVPRGPPPAALGRRRRDQPAQSRAALLFAPRLCPRARLSHHAVSHWRARLRRSARPRRRPAAAAPRAAAARLAGDPCRAANAALPITSSTGQCRWRGERVDSSTATAPSSAGPSPRCKPLASIPSYVGRPRTTCSPPRGGHLHGARFGGSDREATSLLSPPC
ncbi:MAG: DUF222 domain-containing protein [Myxococcales bacterium]|nr:DUF222 domain-containing protein [Myxococcales bacterium]